jgi:hypothetical protein
MYFDDNERDSKRTLGIREKQILYRKAGKRCQNPACDKLIEFDEMQVGHKTAWSKGGSTTLRNSLCLCYRCNKLQGTDSWAVFLKKQGVVSKETSLKKSLQALSLPQLKELAAKHSLKIKGSLVEGDIFNDSYRKAPTKSQYVTKLVKVVTQKELGILPKAPAVKKRKQSRQTDGWF